MRGGGTPPARFNNKRLGFGCADDPSIARTERCDNSSALLAKNRGEATRRVEIADVLGDGAFRGVDQVIADVREVADTERSNAHATDDSCHGGSRTSRLRRRKSQGDRSGTFAERGCRVCAQPCQVPCQI
jgi:hypothetical protein